LPTLSKDAPSINAVSPSRVRCEAGIVVTTGCSFAGLAKAHAEPDLQRMHPTKFPASLGLHPSAERQCLAPRDL